MSIPIFSPKSKKIRPQNKDKRAVRLKTLAVSLLTVEYIFFATASPISGIRRVEMEFKRVDGKSKIGKAIPFIIPNWDYALAEEWG